MAEQALSEVAMFANLVLGVIRGLCGICQRRNGVACIGRMACL